MASTPQITAFTPAPSCLVSSNIWRIYTSCPNNDNCYYLLQGPPSTSDCLPKSYNPDSTAYFSPSVCPSGYTPACSATNTINSLTETAYTCCPSVRSFKCLTDKSTNFWPFQSSLGCFSQFTGTTTLAVTDSKGFSKASSASDVEDQRGAINAYAVQVRFQATDFATTSTSPKPTSISATPGSTISAPAAATTQPSSSETSNTGLSTGAKAGIGVGVAVGVIALVALLWFVYKIGRRRSQPDTTTTSTTYGGHPGIAAGEKGPTIVNQNTHEPWQYAGVGHVQEPTAGPTHELHGESTQRHEV